MDVASRESLRARFEDWEDLQIELTDEGSAGFWWIEAAAGLLRDYGAIGGLPIVIAIVFGVGLAFQEAGWTLVASLLVIGVFGLSAMLILVGREDGEREEEERSLSDEPGDEPAGSGQVGAA